MGSLIRRLCQPRWLTSLFLVAFLPLVFQQLSAAPYPPDGLIITWTQPDGAKIKLRVFGDEFYGRTETEDGFSVVYNEADQAYYIADLSADGERFVPTQVKAGKIPPVDCPKHLKISAAAVETIRNDRRELLVPNEYKEWKQKVKAASMRQALKEKKVSPTAEQNAAGDSGSADSSEGDFAPVTGSYVGLTISVQFPDDTSTGAVDPVNFPTTQAKIENYSNQIGYSQDGNSGSIRDYFSEQSLGAVDYTQVVTPIITLPHPRNYYNFSDYPTNATVRASSGTAGRMIVADAITVLQAQNFDFTALTLNSSDQVVATNVLFAGPSSGVWAQGLWPHRWSMATDPNVGTGGNDIYINDYQITNAQTAAVKIGTFCHESGHLLLKFPDLYDSNSGNGSSAGIGEHCLMGSANHLNGGRTPGPINGYFKEISGWSNMIDITAQQFLTATLPAINNYGYRIKKPGSSTEYFFIENRGTADKWAQYSPDKGILIWHIDEAVNGNGNQQMTSSQHYAVSLEQADGDFDLENDSGRGDSGDAFDSSTSSFTDTTLPDAKWWNGTNSGIAIEVLDSVGANMDVRFGTQPQNTLSISTPNGGEALPRGGDFNITWAANITGNVRIELYRGGVFNSLLSSSEANDGSYTWTVSSGLTLASDYRIRISSVNTPAIADLSDANFSLADEIFPSGGNIPAGWVTYSAANAGWEVNSDEANEGFYSLRNVDIDHSETAAIQYTDAYDAGNVSFDVKVSSESGFDSFRFFIDGVVQDLDPNSGSTGLSGEVAWTGLVFPVTSGTHTFRWEYYKDGSVDGGSDTAWIDSVVLPPVLTSGQEITVEEPVNNTLTSGSSTTNFGSVLLGESSVKTYIIRNVGVANLSGIAVSVDGAGASEFSNTNPLSTTLAPNESTSFTLTYSPSASGAVVADLHIESNDEDEPSFDVALSGVGFPLPSLSAISLSTGTLEPGFDTNNLNYTGAVSGTNSVNVTATVSEPSETLEIQINGGGYSSITSGSPSSSLTLNQGQNFIDVRVTSGTGGFTQVYQISITPGEQSIDFPAIGTRLSNASSFILNGTASSGLPISYSIVAGGSIASLSGSTVTLSGGSGPVTVLASQAGDADYIPAEDVYNTFYVQEADSPIVEIALGRDAKVVRKADGTIWASGWNALRTLGNNTLVDEPNLKQIGIDNDWAAISTGSQHVLALKNNGTLWSWGYNFDGQLGDGTRTTDGVVKQVGSDTNWESIAGGDDVSLGIKTDGTIWAWGENQYYQLGDGTTTDSNVPAQIGSDTDWETVAAGDQHVLATKTGGTLWSWGSNNSGSLGNGTNTTDHIVPTQVGIGTDWEKVSAGYQHSMAVKTNGSLWAWGANSVGRLGNGLTGSEYSPVQIGSDTDWAEIGAGFLHSIGQKLDGSLWMWGSNSYGQIGNGPGSPQLSPQEFGAGAGWTVIPQAMSNSFTTLVAKNDGFLWALGGFSANFPWGKINPVPVLTETDSVAVGDDHSVAIREDGTLWSWGSNFSGKLGDGAQVNRQSPLPIGTDTDWKSVSAGDHHTIALKSDNTLWAWGDASQGQLGSGDFTDQWNPIQIGSDNDWDHVETGDDHSIAIKTDGTLWAWGDNLYGQIGNGTTTDVFTPTQIGIETNWQKAVAGDRVSLAVKTDGTLWAWGDNNSSQLGDGTTTDQLSPQRVGIETDWQTVVAGDGHVLAIKTDGTLWAWGSNLWGRLGDGTLSSRRSPVQIGTESDWLSVMAGTYHSLALKTDGTLWTWGDNGQGRLGNGSFIDQNSPTQVGSDSLWAQLPVGGLSQTDLSYAVDQQGVLWGWGDNGQRLLGDESLEVRVPRVLHPLTQQSVTVSDFTLPAIGNSVTLSATASSGLPVSFLVSGPAEIDGNELTVTGPGDVIVTAYQLGDYVWDSSWPVPMNGDSVLTDLTLSEGTLNPVFDSTIASYDVPLLFGTSELIVSPVASDTAATIAIQVNGGGYQAVASGAASNPLAIAPGSNLIEVRVTARNGVNYRFYRIAVDRPLGPEEQTVDLSQIDSQFTSNGPILLAATSSRGLPVSLSIVAGGNAATLSGNTLSLTGIAGAVTVKASQSGDSNYLGAEAYSTFLVAEGPPFREVATSGNTTMAIRTDGTLWASGYNSLGSDSQGTIWGRLGDGGLYQHASLIQVGGDSDWQTISPNINHTLALKTDGSLWAWGSNSGRLGDGTTQSRATPTRIGSDTDWTKIATGTSHSLALKADGSLWGWGSTNSNGQIGDGTTGSGLVPIRIGYDAEAAAQWESIAAGHDHSLAVKTDGTLWAWGNNEYGQLGDGSTIEQLSPAQIGSNTNWSNVSGGFDHSLGLKLDGSLWAWGNNGTGELGDGTETSRMSPTQIGSSTNWEEVTAGSSTSMARKTDNSLWSWGVNLYGQVGDATQFNRSAPVEIGEGVEWSQINAGGGSRFGIDSDGMLRSWGFNGYGQLGKGIRMPAPSLVNFGPISSLAIGGTSVTALRDDNTLWSWGSNFDGQLGDGSTISRTNPVQVGAGSNWESVVAGVDHTVAIQSDGTIWAWGDNTLGYLGDGNMVEDQATPVQIGSGTTWETVSAGAQSTTAIRTDGTLWAWGSNSNGQLGDGTLTARTAPVQIGIGNDWAEITSGNWHTLARKSDGTLWAWGRNVSGQLGDGTTTQRLDPVQIGVDTDWESVTAGYEHSVARKNDGTIWAWGENRDGRIGDGTRSDRSSPTQIGTDTNWAGILPCETFTIARKTDNTLWAWGDPADGGAGDGSAIPRYTPSQIGTGSIWTALPDSVGPRGQAVLATSSDGTIWGWGDASYGQLAFASPDNTIPSPALPPVAQSIDFPVFTMPGVGQSVTLNATATSGLPVLYLVDGPATVIGNQLTVTGAGLVAVVAYQAGDTVWNSAGPDVSGGNADLSNLLLSEGGSSMTLDPGFQSSLGTYLADVASPFSDTITVTPTLSNANASVEVRANGGAFIAVASGVASQPLPINVGQNQFEILVTAENGVTTRLYSVEVTRPLPSSDAYLSGLTLNGYSFESVFDSSVLSYSSMIPRTASSVTVTPTSSYSQATIEIRSNGGSYVPINSGAVSGALSVQEGHNGVDLRVTAEDGVTTKTYVISVSVGGQVIDFSALGARLSNEGPFALNATTTSGLPVSYTITSGNGSASLSGSTVTLTGTPGPVTFQASQSGNVDYLPASDAFATIYVLPVGPGIAEIALGRHFNLVRKNDGTLWSWGYNGPGALGNGSHEDERYLAQVGTASDWVAITTGYYHVLAVKSNGTLWTWGINTYGQLGVGSNDLSNVPIQVGAETNWGAVAAGENFSIAVKTDGTLWTWGNNTFGQLGDGTQVARNIPVQVGADTNWESVSAGDRHVIAIKTTGTLHAWGDNNFGQLGNGTATDYLTPTQIGGDSDWGSVSAGWEHSLALKDNGSLWAWGSNSSGRLGTGSTSIEYIPIQIGTETNWDTVAAGFAHSVGKKADGTLWLWGDNLNGQLGDTTGTDLLVPTQFGSNSDWAVIPTTMGLSFHTVATRSNDLLWTWGGVSTIQPWGNRYPAPVSETLGPVAEVAAGDEHTLAVLEDGSLWAWGKNTTSGAIGDDSLEERPLPIRIGEGQDWRSVASGDRHSLGLKTDGSLWSWGESGSGRLGTGAGLPDQHTPARVGTGNDWDQVEAGYRHSIGLKTNGTLWGWGYNTKGELGNGTTSHQYTPVQIGSGTNWSEISAGDQHTLAVKSDGTLWAWGEGEYGRLGSGAETGQNTPQQVGSDTDWQFVSAGHQHSMATKADGSLWGWGYNSGGRLGDGTIDQRLTPVRIGADNDWISVVATQRNTFALKVDGSLWGWGDNVQGALADDSSTDPLVPIQIGSSYIWKSLPHGGSSWMDFSLAISRDGKLWGWGDNGQMLLGDASVEIRVPRIVLPQPEQTIQFPSLPVPVYNTPITLTATSDSGLPVRYGISGPAALENNQLTVTGPGMVTLYAYQEGNEIWDSAGPIDARFIAPEITVEQPVGTELTDGSNTIESGDVVIGENGATSYLIRNDGDDQLTGLAVTKDGDHASEFVIGALTSTALAPGESATFDVTFSPTALGARSAAIHIASNDLDENPFDITLAGSGVSPEIGIEEPPSTDLTDGGAETDFESVISGETSQKTYTIRNTGTSALGNLAITIDGVNASQFSSSLPGSTTLQPGGNTSFTVTFAPSGQGVRHAGLHVASDDLDENPFDISLTGVALDSEITIENNGESLEDGLSEVNYGTLISDNGSTSITLTIRNSGTAPLTGLSTSLSGTHSAEFGIEALSTTSLLPNESTTVNVTHTPTSSGNLEAALSLSSNDADENPFEIDLLSFVIERTNLEGWAESFGLTDSELLDTADDDADLVLLLEEYAFNLDPTVADTNLLTPGTGSSGLANIRLVAGKLEVEFVARRSDPNLVYEVQFGDTPTDLGLQPAVESAEVSSINDNFERRKVSDSETITTKSARFCRVRVYLNQP